MSNMNLVLPTVSQTPGPQWASIINSDLALIDQHDHTSNKGLPVPTAGLNINDELKFNNTTPNGLPATGLSYLGLISPQSPPAGTRVYSDSAGDLYYKNAAGADVQLTVGSSVAGTSGSIANLVPPASASYDIGAQAFIWRKDSNQGATMDSGPLRLRDGSAGSNAVTITPASGTSNYTLTLPIAAPGAQSILTVASSGISTFATVNSTLTLTSSLLKVADFGIGALQIAANAVETSKIKNDAVTTSKILDGNVTQAKLGPKTVVSSGPVTATTTSTVQVPISGLSVSFTARSGYPVRVEVVPTGTGVSYLSSQGSAGGYFDIIMSGASSGTLCSVFQPSTPMPVNSLCAVFTPSTPGVHNFFVAWYKAAAGGYTIGIDSAKIIAYEV